MVLTRETIKIKKIMVRMTIKIGKKMILLTLALTNKLVLQSLEDGFKEQLFRRNSIKILSHQTNVSMTLIELVIQELMLIMVSKG